MEKPSCVNHASSRNVFADIHLLPPTLIMIQII